MLLDPAAFLHLLHLAGDVLGRRVVEGGRGRQGCHAWHLAWAQADSVVADNVQVAESGSQCVEHAIHSRFAVGRDRQTVAVEAQLGTKYPFVGTDRVGASRWSTSSRSSKLS
ncbi:MAG: hypothetical protein ACYDH6_16360 [Acidimicrobiales bacterium]